MLELLERKVIGVGENKRQKHIILPTKWERLKDIQAGEVVKIVLTEQSVMIFKNDGSADNFVKALKKLEKQKEMVICPQT